MENMANELTDREMYRLKDGIMHQHLTDLITNGMKTEYIAQRYYKMMNISGLDGTKTKGTT